VGRSITRASSCNKIYIKSAPIYSYQSYNFAFPPKSLSESPPPPFHSQEQDFPSNSSWSRASTLRKSSSSQFSAQLALSRCRSSVALVFQVILAIKHVRPLHRESKSILYLSHNVAVNQYFTVSSLNLVQKQLCGPRYPLSCTSRPRTGKMERDTLIASHNTGKEQVNSLGKMQSVVA
jgi:hypothetical protein